MSEYHTSVLLQEVIDFLLPGDGRRYIDATLGGGGHTKALLEKGAAVLGIDADEDALAFVTKTCHEYETKKALQLVRGNFRDIDGIAKKNGFENVAGILFDLGVSSFQLDSPKRGFSFLRDGPLDMRLDLSLNVKAKDLLAVLPKGGLYDIFTTYGEERFAGRISDSIVSARQIKPIETTAELAEIIRRVVPRQKNGIDPATRVFQALRIAVNDELESLTTALPKAVGLLERGGRLAVISFHSLEDRIVKTTFLDLAKKGEGKVLTKKPIVPGDKEKETNPRSRSAKLRVFERI